MSGVKEVRRNVTVLGTYFANPQVTSCSGVNFFERSYKVGHVRAISLSPTKRFLRSRPLRSTQWPQKQFMHITKASIARATPILLTNMYDDPASGEIASAVNGACSVAVSET